MNDDLNNITIDENLNKITVYYTKQDNTSEDITLEDTTSEDTELEEHTTELEEDNESINKNVQKILIKLISSYRAKLLLSTSNYSLNLTINDLEKTLEKTITNEKLTGEELHWVTMNKFYSKLYKYFKLYLQAKTSGVSDPISQSYLNEKYDSILNDFNNEKTKNGGVDPFIMINRFIIYEEDQ